jgi:tRNA-modifying protein YgfZ
MSALADALSARGAVPGEASGPEGPLHFGDPQAEYQAAVSSAALVARADRFLVRVWGRDPVRMIQGLVTNDLAGLERGAVYAAILTPKGRMVADVRVLRREVEGAAELLLDLPRAASPGVEEHLRRFLPPMFARWEDVSAAETMLGLYGPGAPALARRVLLPGLPVLGEDELHQEDGVWAIGSGYAGPAGIELVLPAARAPQAWDALVSAGARPAGHATLETLRLEAGRPRYGPDMGEETIATEAFASTGLMERAVSFSKGCYTGQEVIVRIAHRGHVNRHLRGLLLGPADPPARRTPLVDPEGGKEVGWITSAARSPRLDETMALGYVRREFGVGAELKVGEADGAPARVVELPFAIPG